MLEEIWTTASRDWQWVGPLVARLSVGLLFAISGGGKLFSREKHEQMRGTLIAAHVPAPAISAVILSLIEFACGTLLLLGFLTPLCSLLLTGVMLGALSTTILPSLKGESLANWLGQFLYQPETLYTIILLWLLVAGPGWVSLDHAVSLCRR